MTRFQLTILVTEAFVVVSAYGFVVASWLLYRDDFIPFASQKACMAAVEIIIKSNSIGNPICLPTTEGSKDHE